MPREPANTRDAEDEAPAHDHGGCLCDHPPTEDEATPDHALPEAGGGVAGQGKERA